MKRFLKYLFIAGFICFFTNSCSVENKEISIVPKPVSQKLVNGNFVLKEGTAVVYDNEELKSTAGYLKNFIEEKYGIATSVLGDGWEKACPACIIGYN